MTSCKDRKRYSRHLQHPVSLPLLASCSFVPLERRRAEFCTEAAPPPPPALPPAHAYDRDASPASRLNQVLFLRLRRGSGQRPYVQRGRLHSIAVPFETDKVGDVGSRKYFGTSNDVAVGLTPPLQCSLAPRAVAPTSASTVSVDITSLSTLDQVDDGSYVDLLGRVVQIDATPFMSALPRKTVTIANGDNYGNMEFFGNHAALGVVEDQVVACNGLLPETWEGTRTCTATLLSCSSLDPDAGLGKAAEVASYVRAGREFRSLAPDLIELPPRDMVVAALAAGEGTPVRHTLQRKNVDVRVKWVLRSMEVALRRVEGSEAEQDVLRFRFRALRLWTGCSLLFVTLNPHDVRSPLLVHFIGNREKHVERVSLGWDDDEMAQYYGRHRAGNPLLFRELAAKWPGAVAHCVHWTFPGTLTALLRVAEPADRGFGFRHADGSPAHCEPGLLGYVAGYRSIVEPQMRLAEHLHMLVRILGFTGPQRLFSAGTFPDTFRRTWTYFASVRFTSEEAFAVYFRCPEALAASREAPLMQVAPRQRASMGDERAVACLRAQAAACGVAEDGRAGVTSALRAAESRSGDGSAGVASRPAAELRASGVRTPRRCRVTTEQPRATSNERADSCSRAPAAARPVAGTGGGALSPASRAADGLSGDRSTGVTSRLVTGARAVGAWTPQRYRDSSLSAVGRARAATHDANAGSRRFMNHVCLAWTCHKGRWAKLGFCRMLFWHWAQQRSRKTDREVMTRLRTMVRLIVEREYYASDYSAKHQPYGASLLQALHDSLLRYDRCARKPEAAGESCEDVDHARGDFCSRLSAPPAGVCTRAGHPFTRTCWGSQTVAPQWYGAGTPSPRSSQTRRVPTSVFVDCSAADGPPNSGALSCPALVVPARWTVQGGRRGLEKRVPVRLFVS